MHVFHNTRHAEHVGRQEIFRGRLVDCHEVPQRLQHVPDELARRPVGTLLTPAADLPLDAAFDGWLQRVAVLDVDYHHGNGTQTCFYERAYVFIASIHGDPIAGFKLRSADYLQIGRALGSLGSLGLPTVFTFEGGYAVAEVGVNAVNMLEGFGSAPAPIA